MSEIYQCCNRHCKKKNSVRKLNEDTFSVETIKLLIIRASKHFIISAVRKKVKVKTRSWHILFCNNSRGYPYLDCNHDYYLNCIIEGRKSFGRSAHVNENMQHIIFIRIKLINQGYHWYYYNSIITK